MGFHYNDTSSRPSAIKATQSSRFIEVRSYHPKPQMYRNAGKRVLDLIFCVLSAPIALLLILPMALLVACDGSRPFYRQERVGRNGRIFRMWKLRSMVPDADAKLEVYLAENALARAEWDKDQKLKSDPRITKIGALLRSTSLDELPQMWNVFKGDMSLVGPRPMMPQQKTLYPGTEYYTLRPGITGTWQTSKRNESSFAERAIFDAAYSKEVSLGEDVRILAATVRVVLKGTGH